MPDRQQADHKDQLLCKLELRNTQSQQALERLELRSRTLESSLVRLQKLYQNAPIGFITFDPTTRIADINPTAVRLLDVVPEAVIGLSMGVLISEQSMTRFMDHMRKSRRSGGKPVSTELEMLTGRGQRVTVQLVTTSVVISRRRMFETAVIDLTAQKAAEEALGRSHVYAEGIVATIPYPIVVLDKAGYVVTANAAFYYTFQTTENQVLRWPVGQMPEVTWLTPGLVEAIETAIADGRPIDSLTVRAEVRRGSLVTLDMNARILSTPAGPNRNLLLLAFEDITRRERAERERESFLAEIQETQTRLEARVKERTHELGRSYTQLRALGEQLVLAHEAEQRRIARELHDQIGQDLTALKIVLGRGKNAGGAQAVKTLNEAIELTDEILHTVRGICGTLRPQVLDDLGLIAGVQWHIKTFAARTGLDITFDFEKIDESLLTPLVKSTIFRVIQEALTNVSRHAKTNAASVMMAMRKGSIDFSVRDGGCGFDAAEALNNGSTGMSSMRERLSLVRGTFEASSSAGMGTIIRAHIPTTPHDNTFPTNQDSDTNRTNHGKSYSNKDSPSRRSSPGAQGTQVPARQ